MSANIDIFFQLHAFEIEKFPFFSKKKLYASLNLPLQKGTKLCENPIQKGT